MLRNTRTYAKYTDHQGRRNRFNRSPIVNDFPKVSDSSPLILRHLNKLMITDAGMTMITELINPTIISFDVKVKGPKVKALDGILSVGL